MTANHQDPTRALTYTPDDRSIRLTLAEPADVKVTLWWQTAFVPPDPKSDFVWKIEGTWDGKLGALSAAETPVRFEGTDVFEFDDGRLRRLRRSFDQLAVADALRLQTIVEPHGEGDLTFGHSMRSWVSKAKPGALGMTWLLARDERRCWDVKAAGSPAFGHSRAASHRDYLTGAATAVRDT